MFVTTYIGNQTVPSDRYTKQSLYMCIVHMLVSFHMEVKRSVVIATGMMSYVSVHSTLCMFDLVHRRPR